MRARLRAVALALAALLLLYGIAFSSGPGETEATRPSSVEPGAGGYSALREWLVTARIRTASLRGGYDGLPELTSAYPTGNVLVITLPGTTRLIDRDLVPLHLWLRAGNTLIVAAALCDAPDWARGPQMRALAADIGMLTGMDAVGPGQTQGPFLVTPAVSRWVPALRHPLTEGVRTVEAVSDRVAPPCAVGLPPGRVALALLDSADGPADGAAHGGGDGAWLLPRGAGWVVLTAQATPFANRALGRADNARWASNLIRGSLGPGGMVIFDDGLQGAPEPWDLHRLLADPRFHASLGAVIALWLLWVAGGTALRAPPTPPRVPDAAAAVAAEGRLLARALEPRETASALLEAFIQRLPEAARAAPEEWLAARPGAAPADIAQLRAWRQRLGSGGVVPPDLLHDLLTRLRSSVA